MRSVIWNLNFDTYLSNCCFKHDFGKIKIPNGCCTMTDCPIAKYYDLVIETLSEIYQSK